jgi:hypothetical protein
MKGALPKTSPLHRSRISSRGGSATMAAMIIRALQPKRLGRIDEDVSGKINKMNKMSSGSPP